MLKQLKTLYTVSVLVLDNGQKNQNKLKSIGHGPSSLFTSTLFPILIKIILKLVDEITGWLITQLVKFFCLGLTV